MSTWSRGPINREEFKILSPQAGKQWLCTFLGGPESILSRPMHFIPGELQKSMPCEGPGCPYCHYAPQVKAFAPVLRFRGRYAGGPSDLNLPSLAMTYDSLHWERRIALLTSEVFWLIEKARPGRMFLIWRTGQTNTTKPTAYVFSHTLNVPDSAYFDPAVQLAKAFAPRPAAVYA